MHTLKDPKVADQSDRFDWFDRFFLHSGPVGRPGDFTTKWKMASEYFSDKVRAVRVQGE